MRYITSWLLALAYISLAFAGVSAAPVDDGPVEIFVNKTLTHPVLENDNLSKDARILQVDKALNGKAVSADGKSITYIPAKNFMGNEEIRYYAGTSDQDKAAAVLHVRVVSGLEGLFSDDQILSASLILFQALLLAFILELALHRIYDYRPFILYGEGRGIKAPLSVALAAILIVPFDFDIVAKLMGVFTGSLEKAKPSSLGYFLTAVIISGGSGTIFRLYKALGVRLPVSPGEGSALENRDFGRVMFTFKRGPGEVRGERKPLELFIDNALVATIDPDTDRFPLHTGFKRLIKSFPVESGARTISVAVSPRYPGDSIWKRELSITRLRKVKMHFDLSRGEDPTIP
ncbi:Ig-like domain-containing protein [Thermodesulfobacteriota bacterium]